MTATCVSPRSSALHANKVGCKTNEVEGGGNDRPRTTRSRCSSTKWSWALCDWGEVKEQARIPDTCSFVVYRCVGAVAPPSGLRQYSAAAEARVHVHAKTRRRPNPLCISLCDAFPRRLFPTGSSTAACPPRPREPPADVCLTRQWHGARLVRRILNSVIALHHLCVCARAVPQSRANSPQD